MWAANDTPCGQPLCLGMNAPEDLVALIPDHWLRFPQPSPILHIILGVVFTILTLVAFVGNLAVIILYCRYRRLQNASNLLVVNLAMADLLMMSKAPIFIIHSFLQRPATGRLGCDAYGAVSLLAGLSAIWFLTAISLDRYRVVRLSLNTHHRFSRSQTRVVVCLVWVASCIVTVLPLLGWNRYVPEGVLSGCTVDYLSERWVDRSFIYLLLVIAWTAPMAAVIFSYTCIVLKVRRSGEELRQLNSQSSAIVQLPHRRTVVRVAVLLCLWAVSWTPYALVVLVSVTFRDAAVTPLLATMPSIFCKASACLNPYVYGLCLPSFRKELARILLPELRVEAFPGSSDGGTRHNGELTLDKLSPHHPAAPTSYRSVSGTRPSDCLGPASLQRFMLPTGDIVLGMTYKEARLRVAKKRRPASPACPSLGLATPRPCRPMATLSPSCRPMVTHSSSCRPMATLNPSTLLLENKHQTTQM